MKPEAQVNEISELSLIHNSTQSIYHKDIGYTLGMYFTLLPADNNQ